MKKGIFVALAALALAVFAVPDAHAWWWGHHNRPDINLDVWGANLISSDEDGIPTPSDSPPLTAFQSAKTRGSSGRPDFYASTAIPAFDPGQVPLDCADLGLAGNPVFQTIVLVYNDGSLLSLVAGPESFYCTDGTIFIVEVSGEIRAGDGRFEGATGTFEGTAQTLPPGETGLFRGELSIHFE